jgi:mono/diheme cytochrome c family protein
MPTFHFTPDQAEAFTRWFAAQAGAPWPFSPETDKQPDGALLAEGHALFEKNQCNSCHPAGGVNPSNPDSSNWGPDLELAAKRLKSQWVADWLKDPQALQPGTKMPTFFGERKDGKFKPFVDDWEEQIRGLQHYLRHMESVQKDGAVSMGPR